MELLNYFLKVSACTVLFFAFYLLVLRKLTFFKINRFYLLSTLLISFIIPTLHFTIERAAIQTIEINTPIAVQDIDLSGQGYQTPITLGVTPAEESFDYYSLLPFLYLSIAACLLIFASWRLFQLIKHTRNSVEKINGLKLVSKRKGFTNCSFFNYVFIDEGSLTEEELAILLRHEEVHAKQFHSVDKILLMIVKAILWFNPVVYLYDKALEQVHEYEADETASQRFGTSAYASLLLRLAVSKNEMPLVHNFVKSPVKERIKMLFNSKSKHMKKLVYLLALPIGLGLLWGFTVDVVAVFPAATTSEKEFTLILDAGHGGKLNGAEVSGYKEKDITLAFTKKIKALAEAQGIKVLTTRDNDSDVSLGDRVKLKGDYLLSVHVNSEPIVKNGGKKNGIEIFTPTAERELIWAKANSMQYYLYEQLKTVQGIKTASKPVQQRLLLLQNSSAAGVVVEMGYLTNQQDLKTITDETKQNELAAAIVKGIVAYKEKTPIDEALDQNYKAAIAPTHSGVQNKPFVQRTNTTTAQGYKSEQIVLNTVSGRPTSIKTIYNNAMYQAPKIWIYVNDQLYSEEAALKFDKNFIAKLSENRGYAIAKEYDIPAANNDKFAYVFWFGTEPKLSAYTAKNRAYFKKYNGTTVSGKVIGFTFSPSSKVADGFLIKTNSGETLKANVEAKFAKQTQKMISKDDEVTIKIYNAGYWKNIDYPVLTSYKISKDGKLLFDRWPKTAKNQTNVSGEEVYVAKSLPMQNIVNPILKFSSPLTVDVKKEAKNTTGVIDVKSSAFMLLSNLNYEAMDSVRVSKSENKLTFYGKAKLKINDNTIEGKQIEVNKNSNIITAYDAKLKSSSGLVIAANFITFDVVTKKYTIKD